MSRTSLKFGRAVPWLLALAVTFGLAAGDAHSATAQDDSTIFIPFIGNGLESPSARALRRVAEAENIAVENLEIVTSAYVNLPLSGASFTHYKIADKASGELYAVAIDSSGNQVSAEAAVEAEDAAYGERYGKLDADLAEHLDAGNGDVVVLIWLNEPATVPQRPQLVVAEGSAVPEAGDVEAIDVFLASTDATRAGAVAAVADPVAARIESLGLVAETNGLAPLLSTSVDAETLAVIASWPEVRRIYRSVPAQSEDERTPQVIASPELEVSRSAIFAAAVHARNIQGHNSKIAQIEVGGRVSTNNPFLDSANPDRIFNDVTSVCAAVSGHSTGVAGIMVSSHTTRYGVAPGAFLRTGGSCGGVWAELSARTTAAINWGARAINISWGSNIGLVPGAMDLFYDTIMFNNFRLIVKSAGNTADGCNGNGNVTSPGLGYNTLTVGNFNDRNTVSSSDDIMDNCSSWRNPSSINNDREKPEIAAPGTAINSTTTASPWTGNIGTGTSFAAPHVTGMAALLYNRNPTLAIWPEATKAIIMATARNNIEGASRLSESDGAGGVYADYADDVARGVNGNWGGQSYSCSTASALILASMNLVAGKQTRVVIVWHQNPSYGSYASRPSADLDLLILNAAGTTVASSASWDNTYEIVEFTPSASGTYRIRVNRHRCDLTPAYIGWAWHRLP